MDYLHSYYIATGDNPQMNSPTDVTLFEIERCSHTRSMHIYINTCTHAGGIGNHGK